MVAPSSEPDKPSTATTPLPSPTPAPHDQDQNTTSTEVEYQDGVPIAHKKIIQPPVGPATTQPDLSELLAKEGITNMEEETHPNGQAMPPGTTTPHQPGHVITPDSSGSNEPPAPQNQNAFNPLDPNNIAL